MAKLKASIKRLRKIKTTDILDDTNIQLLHSFGLICLMVCECCRFLVLGDTFMALADGDEELLFEDFAAEIHAWGTKSFIVQYGDDGTPEKARLHILKHRSRGSYTCPKEEHAKKDT